MATRSEEACSLLLVLAVLTLPRGALPRPHVDSDEAIDVTKVARPKYSLEALSVEERAKVFLDNKRLHQAMLGILDDLSEEDLRALEELMPEEEEMPQGDMPPEDLPGPSSVDDYNATLAAYNASETEMPFPELQKANRESSDIVQVERNKEMRLNSIKTQILSYLGLLGREPVVNTTNPNSHQAELIREMYEKMKRLPQWPPSDIYTEKVQSFYPSCDIPRNTDEELWSNGETMHLLFDLNYPTSLQGTAVNIVAAKLRLYKFSQGNVTVAVSETCPPTPSALDDQVKKQAFHFPANPAAAITVDDKMIRVSVYWYTRSLKKHRVKRKLLDSQMVSVYGESWTEWNVRGAVKAWRETNKNFGLAVEVEDEDGNLLQTQKYFSAMNCSKEAWWSAAIRILLDNVTKDFIDALKQFLISDYPEMFQQDVQHRPSFKSDYSTTSRPIPGFLVDAARVLALESISNQTETASNPFHFNSLLFPMIDLCTVELPESDIAEAVFYHNARYALERHLASAIQNSTAQMEVVQTDNDENNGTEKHRIRHKSHHHPTDTPTPQNIGSVGNIMFHSRQPRTHIETIRRDDGDSIEEITWGDDDIDGHQLRKHIIVQKVIKKSSRNRQDDAD